MGMKAPPTSDTAEGPSRGKTNFSVVTRTPPMLCGTPWREKQFRNEANSWFTVSHTETSHHAGSSETNGRVRTPRRGAFWGAVKWLHWDVIKRYVLQEWSNRESTQYFKKWQADLKKKQLKLLKRNNRVTEIQQSTPGLAQDTIRKPKSLKITACRHIGDPSFLLLAIQKELGDQVFYSGKTFFFLSCRWWKEPFSQGKERIEKTGAPKSEPHHCMPERILQF